MAKHEIKLRPNNSLESKRIYSNFANVSKTPFDISIQFCNVSPVTDFESIVKNDYIYDVPIVAEIAIPKEMVQGLIDALKTQLEAGNNAKKEKIKTK